MKGGNRLRTLLYHGLARIIEVFDPLYIKIYRWQTGFDKPVPPMSLRVLVGGSRSLREFMGVGGESVVLLEGALKQYQGKRIADYPRVLDFGCGCGRILQHLIRGKASEMGFYGCDVNVEAVEWMKAHYDEGHFAANHFDPPMPFQDNSFDLVFSFSVFTHLNEVGQFLWLSDIHRVLRPGGCALLTVHGSEALQMFIDGEPDPSRSMRERLKKDKEAGVPDFLFEPYEDFSSDSEKYPGIRDAYGLTFHSRSYLREKWGAVFDFIGVYPEEGRSFQDVVVLRKQ